MKLTKRQAIEAAGGSAAALARLLGIRHQAVQQWPMDEPIPELRQYQLRELIPEALRAVAEQEEPATEARAA